MVILHDEAYYESRKPKSDLGLYKNVLRFIWDSERKAFLDRTAKEWGQICLFYFCFFSVLGSIFAAKMWISVYYISKLDRPYFQYPGVSMPNTPGQNIRRFRSPWNYGSPGIVLKPNSPVSTSSPIIWVNDSSANARPKRYIIALTDFLQEYKKDQSEYNLKCNDEHFRWYHSDKPCFFDIKQLGVCGRKPYGYTRPLQPCVLIKFNKRFDWVPHYYNKSSNLPENMPQKLKQTIRTSRKFYVWLSCDGANNVDKEHIGHIDYIPGPGFPVEYFPFTGQPNYLSPIVALRFRNLTPNRLVTVECILWAFNIDQRYHYSLDFQIIVDH